MKLNDGIIGEMLVWLVQLPSISKKGKMKGWERALLEGPQEVEMSPDELYISFRFNITITPTGVQTLYLKHNQYTLHLILTIQ